MFFELQRAGNNSFVIYLRYTAKPASMEEFEAYLNALKHLYSSKKPFSLLIDTRRFPAGMISWSYLKRQAEFMQESENLSRRYLRGVALVVTSPWVKTLIQTLFLIKAPVSPTQTFHDSRAAEKWVTGLDLGSPPLSRQSSGCPLPLLSPRHYRNEHGRLDRHQLQLPREN